MFKWIGNLSGGGASSHPLANPKEQLRIVGELRTADSTKAVEEIGHWAETLPEAEEIKLQDRFEIIKLLDEAVQPHRMKTARDYATIARQSKFREQKTWSLNHDLWAHLSSAYLDLMRRIDANEKGADTLKAQTALISVRCLRAQSQALKWLYVRYGPINPETWQSLGRAFQFADKRKAGRTSVVAYSTVAGETTPEQELLRALLISASAPDGLTPGELEVCERMIAHFSKAFELSTTQQKDSTYWFDLSAGKPPARLAAPPASITPDLRLFSCGHGHAGVQALTGRIAQTREIPRDLDVGGHSDPAVLGEVLHHLEMMWSPQPPIRKSPRMRLQTRVSVVHRFETMLELCSVEAAPKVDIDLDFGATGVFGTVESWVVENVSAGGFGATIQQKDADWLKVGRLILVQAEGKGTWELAMVRRLAREPGGQSSVGVQVISRNPVTAAFTTQGGAWNNGQAQLSGLFMPDHAEPGAALIVVPDAMYNPGEQVRTALNGKVHILFPIGTLERDEDFELIKFRDMVQE